MNSTFVGTNKQCRFGQHFVAAAEDRGEGLLLWIKLDVLQVLFAARGRNTRKTVSKQAERAMKVKPSVCVFACSPSIVTETSSPCKLVHPNWFKCAPGIMAGQPLTGLMPPQLILKTTKLSRRITWTLFSTSAIYLWLKSLESTTRQLLHSTANPGPGMTHKEHHSFVKDIKKLKNSALSIILYSRSVIQSHIQMPAKGISEYRSLWHLLLAFSSATFKRDCRQALFKTDTIHLLHCISDHIKASSLIQKLLIAREGTSSSFVLEARTHKFGTPKWGCYQSVHQEDWGSKRLNSKSLSNVEADLNQTP